jgi:glycosyltransferase involved in cell wall biosynthesis
MADRVAESPLLSRFPMTVIPNGLDVTEFAPGDTCGARDALGVPQDAKVVLFVAESTANRRKGFDLLAEALGGLRDADNLLLLSVGRHQPELNGRIPHRHLGSVEHYQLPLVYRAADLFVIPSLQDNLPNTVLESMACGTPVVGFAVGGIPDMVRQDATGLLARAADPDALRVAIDELLGDAPRRLDMGRRCRQVAVEEYSLERQARRYGELYQSLIP